MSKKYPIFSDRKPSEEIQKEFATESTVSTICEMCGRIHITGDWNCDNEEDEEKEKEKWEKNPERYVLLLEYDIVHYGHYHGKQVVPDCPCNFLSRVEDDWWTHRDEFLRFIQAKYKRRGRLVREEENLLQETLASVPKE